MQPEIKAKLIAALRSGDYQQGRETLREGNKFCCLGVLCDVDGARWKPFNGSTGFVAPGYGSDQLQEQAKRKFGITDDEHIALISMNDGEMSQDDAARWGVERRPHSFAEIADWIEEHL